jgi:hypothetical protein
MITLTPSLAAPTEVTPEMAAVLLNAAFPAISSPPGRAPATFSIPWSDSILVLFTISIDRPAVSCPRDAMLSTPLKSWRFALFTTLKAPGKLLIP